MAETWGDVFNRWKKTGVDPADAAMRADEWEARQKYGKRRTNGPDRAALRATASTDTLSEDGE